MNGLELPTGANRGEAYTKALRRIELKIDGIEAKLDKLLEAKKPKARKKATDNPFFDTFWKVYPVKKSKQAAQRAFNNIRWGSRKVGIHDLILADIKYRLANDRQWIEGYIPHAATYLNGERWNDSIEAIPVKAETLPKDNEQLQAWAGNRGHRSPYPGEQYPDYRRYLQAKLENNV